MLYLVSGASRSGKTLLAKRILEREGITYLSLDWIVMGFTNGMPECGIHDKLFPDEIAAGISKFFDAMCESMLWTEEDIVIEGEAVMPDTARALIDRHPDHVRCCFLGYTAVDVDQELNEIKQFSVGRDWLTNEPDEYIRDHIGNMVAHSKLIESGCEENQLRYFDTSEDLVAAVGAAMRYLVDE